MILESIKKSLAVLATVALATSAQASVINGDFETGDLSGWMTLGGAGSITAETVPVGVPALEGTYSALLNASSFGSNFSAAEMETFLGLSAGSITAADLTDPTPEVSGVAMKQDISVAAGDVLSFTWNAPFLEGSPSSYNDAAFFATVDTGDVIVELADGVSGPTGATFTSTYSFLSSGIHTIGFAVINGGDGCCGATLIVDDIEIVGVPAPLSVALFLTGLGLVASRRMLK